MKNAHRLLSFLLASLPLLAQESAGASPPKIQTPQAEQLFRDAWWAESGANDTATALRGYLEAASATGPTAVRARALLFAGRLQQRQGKQQVALDSFRRLLTEFATETELVNEARSHLRELTAIDLRQNYDEWYERRLFSEEVQLVILGKLEALAGQLASPSHDQQQQAELQRQRQALTAEIMVFGKGAVPALRKAALGRHEDLANRAIEMLFQLGETPPLLALVEHSDWLDDSELVAMLLTKKPKERLPEQAANSLRGRWLAAILEGPDALAERILASPLDGPAELSSVVRAVLTHANARARLVDAMQQPGMALFVREAIEDAFAADEGIPLDATEWLKVGEDPLRAELRNVSIARAARGLRSEDAEALDRLLAMIEDPATPTGYDHALVDAFAHGLSENRIVELLPWTADRLVRLLRCLPACDQPWLVTPLLQLRRVETSRQVLAEALFTDPLAVCAGFRKGFADAVVAEKLQQHFNAGLGDDADVVLLARRWHAAMAAALAAKWPQYDSAARLAAVVVLQGTAIPALPATKTALLQFLRQQQDSASAELKDAITNALNNLGG